jgi:hypothetical protein
MTHNANYNSPNYRTKMDATKRGQPIKRQATTKGMLTRIQTIAEAGDREVNEIQVTFDNLSGILNR